jgi:serine/threonine-protein kinase SRPK3
MHNLFENGYQMFVLYVSERIPPGFGKEDTEKLAGFLWSALQECPEDRRSATGLLNHPFLVG